MKCGYFDADNREYVITTPKTPVKWINYLGTLAFGGLIDQTGGMLLCKGDPAHNRITKYIPQLPDADFRGSTLYVRVKNQEGGYDVCSPYFTPSLSALDEYRCHVGTGYQRIVSRKEGLVFDSLFFVPPQIPVVIWRIRVKNVSRTPANVDLIPVVEYTHFDALKQFTNADWVPQTMQSRAQQVGENGMALLQYAFMRQETAVNFLASRRGVSSFESDRKRFLGNEGYGTWRLPAALSQAELSCTEVRRGDNIGALMLHLGELMEGEEKERVVLVGQCAPGEVQPLVERLGTAEAVQTEFAKLLQSWEKMLSVYQCRTPEETVNIMVNLNNPRQCHTTLNWSRYLSLYQLGLGARGMGVRDSAQDSMGAVSLVPDHVKDLLRKLLSVQRKDGSAMHQFYPATMEANEGDSRESKEGKHVYGDDHLWLILAVCSYLKETG
ncbi:MAG: glycosyl transferase, partial [Lentisphaerae bacterium]